MVGQVGQVLRFFKAFHRPNTTLGCWSIFSGGDLAAMRSTHIYFWVTFTEPFTANRESILAF